MKKFFIIASAALLALVACNKVENTAQLQKEIRFQVANYVQTKATGVQYPQDSKFGTYAWYTNEENTVTEFIKNEKVGYVNGEWRVLAWTPYWPKTGSVDFISYSPWTEDGPSTISGTKLEFLEYKVGEIANEAYTANGVDLMYADKALKMTKNVDEVKDNAAEGTTDSGFNGVPTFFHHALAKLSFKIQANFLEHTNEADANAGLEESTTTWAITVKSAVLAGIYTQGDLKLTSTATATAWTKPTDNVWTGLAAPASLELIDSDVELNAKYKNGELTGDKAKDIAEFGYVIPQKLVEGKQTLTLVMDIVTTLPDGTEFTQPDVTKTVNLSAASSLKKWEMNQNIIYTILVKPTYGSDPTNPDNPEDDTITFDPAIADWDVVDAATIQL